MKLERTIAIVMLLLQKDKTTAKELAEMFEVSVRTIYRDIDSINLAGIPIQSTSGPNGGISIMENYKVEKGIFTEKDIIMLLMGTGFLANTFSNLDSQTTLAKIKSFVPENIQNEIKLKSEQVEFELYPWIENPNLKSKISMIQGFMANKTVVTFSYWGNNGKNTNRIIEPHKLLFKDDSWYLSGYCLQSEDFRLFKLSRISKMSSTSDSFAFRSVPNKITEISTAPPPNLIVAKLLVDSSILSRVLDFCDETSIVPADNGKYIVDFLMLSDYYSYSIIISFGERCECLSPQFVRDELEKKLEKMLNIYKTYTTNGGLT